ncbi:Sec-independent protein secretion pathway component [Clostridium pasteurianum DSM 525 = ATCC 6013]|uniref:Sec-independent protein secretion pathway component n=1 Tax=Clostridium pasteurianum DSM 525 = ATCC 6013 TaxID=1262449 RepID=A0A0H3J624_CLOPA|nr:twin-arginine translocase TatA/TatE family subunit [Clostridium pasteurianum]AJA49471.1 Sec-independent protein secretion pathway component [Clostridium pasteurianum DSM 525 = ATCC 6013]AJA53459.1 Sec-independent protein secretion pathway component [Clostridium pasteurianum DSM 525 = ATCC 6013]AOZ76636.1 preprotein translocase subunit TatB [Clostridium pasteurianum DSM 525 = ATCC 6013]AOZ80433.1 preprotein translocase subunit TatB [Clostridium pasteurianum]ELP58413.1 sec-independent translo
MFNIGFGELILILLIAFLVVGPQDLPKVARALARALKYFHGIIGEITQSVNLDSELTEISNVKSKIQQTVKNVNPLNDIDNEINDVKEKLKSTEKTLKKSSNF